MPAPFPILYDFHAADLDLLHSLRSFLNPEAHPTDEEVKDLRGNVFLDYSFQGWTAKLIDAGEVLIKDDIISDLNGERPWDDAERQGILYLGLYCTAPRKIILFPNAIKLVAGSKRFKGECSGAPESVESLLTKVVLIHEIAHWFTLVPNKHDTRLALAQPARRDLAETFAELLSWVTFNLHYAGSPKLAAALLRVQYLTNDPAGGYEYQLYWFWLVLTGLGSERKFLQGSHCPEIHSDDFKERLEAISKWASSDEIDPRILLIRIAKSRKCLSNLLW
jgi:hypothetical protein